MPKLKKTKKLTFDKGTFRIETTVASTLGLRPRTLHGEPWIAVDGDIVRVGCIHFTTEALDKLVALRDMVHRSRLKRVVYQDGNYGDEEF